jgi:hypothetical protein
MKPDFVTDERVTAEESAECFIFQVFWAVALMMIILNKQELLQFSDRCSQRRLRLERTKSRASIRKILIERTSINGRNGASHA